MTMAGLERPAYFLYHTLWCALDWLFPPTCGGCSLPGTRWCEDCQKQVVRVQGRICPCCGDPLTENASWSGPCRNCLNYPPAFLALRSFGIFDGHLREALHQLKYQRDMGLGEALSKHLIEIYNEVKWDVNLVVPVPLSQQRLKERGYNQSGLLGRPFAYAIQKAYQPDVLQRTRDTCSQVGLSAFDRHQNVNGAFQARADKVNGKAVLVIDDVTTTGSTINACAQALYAAGASAVYGLTLARAVLKADVDDRSI